MAIKNYPVESSELIKRIRKLDFVKNARTESMNGICWKTFNNSLEYKKEINTYIAKINLNGYSYKVFIEIKGNRPNPRYEKMIKRCY
jgi:hypothetical protein